MRDKNNITVGQKKKKLEKLHKIISIFSSDYKYSVGLCIFREGAAAGHIYSANFKKKFATESRTITRITLKAQTITLRGQKKSKSRALKLAL